MPEYTAGLQDVAPEGDYTFVVDDAGEKESKGGNPMIEVQLLCTNAAGETFRVFDQLVFTPKAFWKIDQFRISTGDTLVEGETVSIEAEDCVNRKGRVHLIVDSSYGGRARNKVGEYLPPLVQKTPPPADPTDIPF